MSTNYPNRSADAFKVPKGYFKSVNTRIHIMTTATQKNPFSTPKGYFVSIDPANWTKKTKKQHRIFQLNILRYTAVAAVILVAFILTNISSPTPTDTIEDSEIFTMLEANWIGAHEYELVENITTDWSLEIVSTNSIYEHLISNPNTMDEYYLLD